MKRTSLQNADSTKAAPSDEGEAMHAFYRQGYAAGMEAAAVIAGNMPACPFDGKTDLEPHQPCPVCGDRGDDLSAPSNCRSVPAAIRAACTPK
jgi:hypothetical protein